MSNEQADRRRRRADAAAERARRRAMRPWYQRPWAIAGAVAAVLVVLVVIGALGAEDTTQTAAVAEQPASTAGDSQDPADADSEFDQWAEGIHVAAITDCGRLESLTDEAYEHAGNDGSDAEALLDFEGVVVDRIDEVCGDDEPPAPAPDDNPPADIPEPDDTLLQIGDGAELTTDGTPSEIITVQHLEYSTTPYDEYGSGPRRDVFLIFKIRVDGLASTSVDELDFYVVTRNGTRIDQGAGNSYNAVNYDDTLGYAEVNAGQHKTGYIVFDSPVRHGTLEYDPNFEGEPVVSWEF